MSDQYIDELKYQIESLNAENKMLRDIIQKNKEQQNYFLNLIVMLGLDQF